MDGSGQPTLCRSVPLEDGSEILEEEVRRGVLRLKVRKAAGICGIMPVMLKAGGQVLVEWLTKLFNMVWSVGKAPCDWRNGAIVAIHKKGSKMGCTNYRGISLMSIVGKLFARVWNERVKVLTVDELMDEQGGFRDGRGCTDPNTPNTCLLYTSDAADE